MKKHTEGQEADLRQLSFPEIILTYARTPPFAVAEHLKIGRRPRKRSALTYDILILIELSAMERGWTRKDVHEECQRVLNSPVDTFSRALTVDELVLMCEKLGLSMNEILTKVVKTPQVSDSIKE